MYFVGFAQKQTNTDSLNWKQYWKIKGRSYIHISQGAQMNWAKGGENLFSSLVKTNVFINYKQKNHWWENKIIWNYGFMLVNIPETSSSQYRKNDDVFDFNSSYGIKATKKLYYNAQLNFKTLFFPGYNYPNDSIMTAGFLSPAYIIFSLGMNYKPNDNFTLMLSPLTSKTTMVVKAKDVDETKYGIKKGERLYKEIGAYFKLSYKYKIAKNIETENKLTLFSNYEYKPQNIDLEFQSDINFKINKYVKAVFTIHFIYDDDQSIPVNEFVDGKYTTVSYTKGLQFQEKIMIGIGIDF